METLLSCLNERLPPVGEWGDDQPSRVAQVLVAIRETCVGLSDYAVTQILMGGQTRQSKLKRSRKNVHSVWKACNTTYTYKHLSLPSHPCTHLVPVESQLAEPLKGIHVIAACLGQLIDDIPSVNLHCDQSHDLQTKDFRQIATDNLRIALKHGDLEKRNSHRKGSLEAC